jgi:alkylhydroperoxidase family enzyme
VQALYDRFRNSDGSVDNILRIHAANPKSWTGHYDLYVTLMRGTSELSRAQREMIGVVVSAINECHY